jgi:DNA-binding NarL/FixJ family response regulator
MSSTPPAADPAPGADEPVHRIDDSDTLDEIADIVAIDDIDADASPALDVIDLSEPEHPGDARDGDPTVRVGPISAALYGRHRILLDGLALLLAHRSEITLIGAMSDEASLLDVCHRERPDVVVLLVDTGMNAEPLVATMRRRHRSVRIIAVATRRSRVTGNRLQAAGASAVLPHGIDLSELVAAVMSDAAVAEVTPLGPRVARPGSTIPLTERELEVLRLVAAGMTTGEIGPRLGISPKTVENHKQRLFAKLGVQNQAHAVSIAMRAGIIDLRGQRLLADA